MFSSGQLLFAICFCVVFTIALIFSYKKDKNRHTHNYKGVRWVVVGFAGFVILLFAMKHFLSSGY